MSQTLLTLAPESGHHLRMCGLGFDDQGSAYTFRTVTRPVFVEQGAGGPPTGQWGLFRRLEVHVRRNARVDLTMTPIVDGVEQTDQAVTVSMPTPTGWTREVADFRFAVFARKIQFKLEATTLYGQFHLDGAFVEAVPHAAYAVK